MTDMFIDVISLFLIIFWLLCSVCVPVFAIRFIFMKDKIDSLFYLLMCSFLMFGFSGFVVPYVSGVIMNNKLEFLSIISSIIF